MDELYLKLLQAIGEDPTREGLVKTPARAAKAFQFLTRGYTQSLDDIVNNAVFEAHSKDMIILKDIEIYSM